MESSPTDYENLENTANDSENINIHEHFKARFTLCKLRILNV